MTLKDNGDPHDEDEEVSNAECIKAVLRTSFKKGDEEIKVLYAAEIDALDSGVYCCVDTILLKVLFFRRKHGGIQIHNS